MHPNEKSKTTSALEQSTKCSEPIFKSIEKTESLFTSTLRRSIKLDRVHPSDFLNLNTIYCCEQCSHFDPQGALCSLGFSTKAHLRKEQLKTFKNRGHMAFCRFLEID